MRVQRNEHSSEGSTRHCGKSSGRARELACRRGGGALGQPRPPELKVRRYWVLVGDFHLSLIHTQDFHRGAQAKYADCVPKSDLRDEHPAPRKTPIEI